MTGRLTVAVAVLLAAFAAIYLPDVGHGFVRDDFMWIRAGRLTSPSDVARLLASSTGFYRPVVSATFGADYAIAGLAPFAYALTNVVLLLACATMLALVARRFGLSTPCALVAAAAWVFNFHAVGMALLWLSGRTALLLCLFSLLALHASLRRMWWQTAGWSLLAMLSKEEAIVLPFTLSAWAVLSSDRSWPGLRRVTFAAGPVFAALAIYLALRANTDAMGPATAPSYYQFSFAPALIARNVGEYLDRAATAPAVVALIVWAVARTRPSLADDERALLMFAALWFASMFAITLFLPVRSDLYALTPAAGSCLAAGAVIQALLRQAPRPAARALGALVLVPLLLIPVYRSRNTRWITPAETSRRALADLQASSHAIPDGSRIVVIDDADGALASAFDSLFPDAVSLFIGRNCTGQLAAEGVLPSDGRPVRTFRYQSGHLVAVN